MRDVEDQRGHGYYDRIPYNPSHVRYSEPEPESESYRNQMAMTETITSAANPLVKEVRRAVVKGGLTQDGLCIAESVHLLGEALRSGCEIAAVLVADSAQPSLRKWHR